MFDKIDNERKTYCIVRLMEDDADYDYMVKVLEQASEIRPELPILLLTSKGKDKGSEEVYLKVLRRRFKDRRSERIRAVERQRDRRRRVRYNRIAK